MRELRQIVDRWHQGTASILVTLVRVQGSSYRQPGARLLVGKNGNYEGSISAGCLEADLLRKAAWLTRNGSVVERYSTLFDEAADIPFGLGCGGVLDVLLEPVEAPECHALLRASQLSLAGSEHIVITWLPKEEHPMMRAVFRLNGEVVFASHGLSKELLAEAWMTRNDSGLEGTFVERLTPPQRLFVFGAGDDARPLVTIACLLGWRVVVVDGRSHLARKARFPEENVEVVSTPEAVIARMTPRDAAVIMTHSYEQDSHFLTALLPLRLIYLGLLGSRQRSSLLIAEAAAKLDWSLSECCEYIRAPIGLNIGGEGPEAIALAIVAEAQACCAGKLDDIRKLSAEKVERYLESTGSRFQTQTRCSLDIV